MKLNFNNHTSCQLCKTRKVKCDRLAPSCGWCTRNGATCEYRARKKPGLRAGYGRELEMRLDKLERILVEHEEALRRVQLSQVVPVIGQVVETRPRAGSRSSDGQTDSTLERDALVFPRLGRDESMRSPPLAWERDRDGTLSAGSQPSINGHTNGVHHFSPPSAPAPAPPLQHPSSIRRYSVGGYYQPQPQPNGVTVSNDVSFPPISAYTPGHDRRTSLEFINNPPTHANSSATRPRGGSLGTKRILEEPEHGWREPPMMRAGMKGAYYGRDEQQKLGFVYSSTVTSIMPSPSSSMPTRNQGIEAR